MTRGAAFVCVLAVVISCPGASHAHDGPPFPIVSDRTAGPYTVSVWTDPDTTDDGSAGGQFWVMIAAREGASPIPPSTRARVTAASVDRPGPERAAATEAVRGDTSNQFAALVLDHEGRFRVRVDVDGPLGMATLESEVSATYDLRPPPVIAALYLLPFVLAGGLWAKLLLKRRHSATQGASARRPA